MPEPGEEPAAQPTPASRRPRRRWLQISLRTLLLVIALVAVAAVAASWYEAPYRRQRAAMAAIEKAGGTYQASPAGPAWLRRLFGEDSFRNVTLVNVADCDDPAAYIDHVARLPALETLVVGGLAFTDDHLNRLHGLTTLSGLVLDCTEVTDAGIAALSQALPEVEVYRSERLAIAAVANLGGYGVRGPGPNSTHRRLEKLVGQQYFYEAANVSIYGSPARPVQCHDADMSLLAKLTHLETLTLDGVQFDEANLARIGGFTNLRQLLLQRLPQVGDAGVAHLGRLQQLPDLSLSWTNVGDEGLASLRDMTRLRSLGLVETRITDAGLAHLQGFTQMLDLHLGGTQITDAGLAQLKTLSQLTALRLSETRIGDAGLPHVGQLSELTILELNRTRVTDAGMANLRGLRRLSSLEMAHTKVGDAGLAQLQEMPGLAALRLNDTRVTDAGIAHLEALNGLRYLFLHDTKITDAALKHIARLKKLANVVVPADISPAAVQELRRALPNCQVQHYGH